MRLEQGVGRLLIVLCGASSCFGLSHFKSSKIFKKIGCVVSLLVVLCTFSNIPAAVAAEVTRHSQLSSCCQGRRYGPAVKNSNHTWRETLFSSHAGRTPCCANSLCPSASVVLYLCTPDMRSASAKVRPPSLNRNSMVSIPVTLHKVIFDYLTLIIL